MNSKLIRLTSLLLVLCSTFGCIDNETVEYPPIGFGIEHTKNPISLEVSFTIKLTLPDESGVTTRNLHFFPGDGTEFGLSNPSVSQDIDATILTYHFTYVYPSQGRYSVMTFLEEVPLQRFSKDILLDN